jgi:6-phosphogluconolactonase (cycloisomerase 2 family)
MVIMAGFASTQGVALGQSRVRSVFVSNNGNLEGSVTAFAVSPTGTLSVINRIVTGSRAAIGDYCPGCNAYEISMTPNGKYLATGHPSGDTFQDGITIFSIAPNGAITQVLQHVMTLGTDGPLDLHWIDNQYLACMRTGPSPDQIAVYEFNPAGPTLTFLSFASPGNNSLGYITVHPNGGYVYGNDSSTKVVRAWSVGAGGSLTLIDSETTGAPFPLEITISPDGKRMYSAGGISATGHEVIGLDIATDGTLTAMSGTPYVSPGTSPSNVFVNGSTTVAAAGHGTDATVRTFTIDGTTGALTSTGNMFDVGLQGTVGDVRFLGNQLFVTDNSTAIDGIQGLYSFTVSGDGSMTMNGSILPTGGIAARSIAVWAPCDLNCDGLTDLLDADALVLALLDPAGYAAAYPNCYIFRADLNSDGTLDGRDAVEAADIIVP